MIRLLALALVLAGCRQALGIPGSGREGDFHILISVTGATGATDGASVLLIRDGDQGTVEVLSDATTELVALLADGQRYEIQPNTGNCTIENGTGTIDNGDADGIEVTCDGLAALGSFGFSAPLTFDPAFDGSLGTPHPQASVIVQSTDWDPVPIHSEARVDDQFFAGLPAGSGPFPITDTWTLVVNNAGLERPYMAVPTRAAPAVYGVGTSSMPTTGARLGSALATAGTELAVGAPDAGPGRVFVSTRTGTAWLEHQVLAGPSDGARFGAGVAITADTLAIGAPGVKSVFVFKRAGDSWEPLRTLTDDNATPTFGTAIAIADQNTIYVGDPERAAGVGAVVEFKGAAATTLPVAVAGNNFGAAIAIAGTLLAVGAPGNPSAISGNETDLQFAGAGAVYVFDRSDFSVHAFLKAPTPGIDDRFGASVGLESATGKAFLIAGAPLEDSKPADDGSPDPDDNTLTSSGAAYLFALEGSWRLTAMLKAPNADFGDNFGRSVGIASSRIGSAPATHVIAIGAPFEDSGQADDPANETVVDSGAIYALEFDDAGIPATIEYGKAARIVAHQGVGTTLALTAQTLITGAPEDDSGVVGWTMTGDHTVPHAGAVLAFR